MDNQDTNVNSSTFPESPKPQKKSNYKLSAALAFAGISVLIAGGLAILNNRNKGPLDLAYEDAAITAGTDNTIAAATDTAPSPNIPPAKPMEPEREKFEGFKKTYGYEIAYPQGWHIASQTPTSLLVTSSEQQNPDYFSLTIFKDRAAVLPSDLKSVSADGVYDVGGEVAEKFTAKDANGNEVAVLKLLHNGNGFLIRISPKLFGTVHYYMAYDYPETPAKSFTVVNGQILTLLDDFQYKIPRGSVQNGQITVSITDDLAVTFAGNTDLLDFFYLNTSAPMFYYNSAEIGTGLKYPNSGYSVNSATYACNGRFTHREDEPEDYYYCETNGIDHISQYEFSGAGTLGFGTGGGHDTEWTKIYAKRINGKDIFVTLKLDGDGWGDPNTARAALYPSYCPTTNKDDYNCLPEQLAHYKKILSKEYLDSLLQEPKNAKLIKETDEFFASLQAAGN